VRNGKRWVDGGGVGWGPIIGLLIVVGSVHGASAIRIESGDFSVSIAAAPVASEPGLPVVFSLVLAGGTAPFQFSWSSSSNLTGSGENFTAWATGPGNLTVTVIVVDSTGALAAASYGEWILPGVTVGLSATNASDTGAPFSLAVTVGGGVAPYAANLSLDGGGSLAETFPAAGTYPIPTWSSWTGPINASAVVTDALGATARTDALVTALAPRPEVVLAGGPESVEVGVRYTWWASVVGGTPPINWTVTGAGATENSTDPMTSTSSPGTISWSASFNASGNASVEFVAIDAGQAAATLTVPVRVAPPVDAFLSVPSGGPRTSVNVTVLGGLPPYEIVLSATDGESWAGNASAPGTFTWTLDPRGSGAINVTLFVADAAGGNSSALREIEGSVPVDPVAPAAAVPDPLGTLALVLVALGGIAGAGIDRFVRRRPAAAASPPEPRVAPAIEEVRRILEESDSLERETVCLTGEERGSSREAIEAGIEHWVHLGRIEIVRGSGGEQLLRWREENEPTPTEHP
jgi:hypothetical protein